jgi:hypothetical protein
MLREKTALEYYVTNIFLSQKLLFRNPSKKIKLQLEKNFMTSNKL